MDLQSIAKHHHFIKTSTPLIERDGTPGESGEFNLFNVSDPLDVRRAYNVTPVAPLAGKKQVVITIVIPYHYANLQNDFNTFCSQNGLPPATLDIYHLNYQMV